MFTTCWRSEPCFAAPISRSSFFLRIDRGHGSSRRLSCDDLSFNVLELGVPVGVALAFMCLAIDLPGVFELFREQRGDGVGGDLVAAAVESRRELGRAFDTHLRARFRPPVVAGSTSRCKTGHQRQIALSERLATPALAAGPPCSWPEADVASMGCHSSYRGIGGHVCVNLTHDVPPCPYLGGQHAWSRCRIHACR